MSVDTISVTVGIVLSLAAGYVPGFNTWYNQLASQGKALFMLVAAFVYTAVTFGLGCYGFVEAAYTCTLQGAFGALGILAQFAIANQTTYLIAVRPFNKPKPVG